MAEVTFIPTVTRGTNDDGVRGSEAGVIAMGPRGSGLSGGDPPWALCLLCYSWNFIFKYSTFYILYLTSGVSAVSMPTKFCWLSHYVLCEVLLIFFQLWSHIPKKLTWISYLRFYVTILQRVFALVSSSITWNHFSLTSWLRCFFTIQVLWLPTPNPVSVFAVLVFQRHDFIFV